MNWMHRIDYRKKGRNLLLRKQDIIVLAMMIMLLEMEGMTACGQRQELSDLTERQVTEQQSYLDNTESVSQQKSQLDFVSQSQETEMNIEDEFYAQPLSEDIKQRITGISYPAEPQADITYEDLSYVHVLHYDFNGEINEGELICNRAIEEDLVEIFRGLYDAKYPMERIQLIDEYGGDDEASMEDNNTSCFNYRTIAGSDRLSNHSYGCAIDINPLYNPYVSNRSDGTTVMQPLTAEAFTDRSAEFEHKITTDDLCYQLFTEHGFTWGGDWNNPKDYQHFEKSMENE